MVYQSETWGVEVLDEIAREFTSGDGTIDDNLAGLHEVRARMAEEDEHKDPAELAAESALLQTQLESEGWRVMIRGQDQTAA